MRVTFLTHYYPPEVGAPQARISALAQRLAARGHAVAVHTGFPHYPTGMVHAPHRNRPLERENRGGVRVVRSLVYAAPNRGTVRRLVDHAAFAASALATAAAAPPADVVVAETPPLFLAGAAIAYARAKRAALVLNVADRWPASAVELGALTDPRVIAAAEWLERHAYRAAARITVPTEGLVAGLEAHPDAAGKVRHMPPAVDIGAFADSQPPPDGPFRVVYAGTLGLAQGVGTLVEAARLLADEDVRFTIAGEGAEADELRSAVQRKGVDNIEILGLVPHERVAELYAGASAALVLLRDRPIFRGALPTKMLEAMAAARPVVVSADGESAALIERHGAGVTAPPENPQALADAILRLARDRKLAAELGAAGRRAAVEHFSIEDSADRWERLLSEVAGA